MMSMSIRTHRNLAREQLINEALSVDADYVLFLDDDMVPPSDLIERLMSHNVEVVSGLAFTRVYPHKPCLLDGVVYKNSKGEACEKYQMISDYPKNKLVEVAATGMACTLVSTKVLKEMEIGQCTAFEGAGEDVEFFRKVRAAGYKVYCDTATVVGHLAERPVITQEDWLQSYSLKQKSFEKMDEMIEKRNKEIRELKKTEIKKMDKKKDDLLFSIIIPTRRGADAINKTIESIKKHTIRKYELVIQYEEAGYNAKLNKAVNEAKGDYLIFLHDDIEVTDGWLDEINELGVFLTGEYNNTIQQWGGLFPYNEPCLDYDKTPDYASLAMMSKEVANILFPLDEYFTSSWAADVDLGYEIKKANLKIKPLKGKIIHWNNTGITGGPEDHVEYVRRKWAL